MTEAEKRAYAAGIEAAAKCADKTSTCLLPSGHMLSERVGDAIRALSPSASAPVVPKVKPLVWEYHPTGKLTSNNMGGSYIIDTRGPRLKWLKWPGGYGPDRETVEEMQAAAQADHEARILSQIDMAPVTVEEAAIIVADAIDADMATANRMINAMKGVTLESPAGHWLAQCLRALAEQEGE